MSAVQRATLIAQLRSLLHLAESPAYDCVEGEVGDTDISIDVTHPEARSGLIGALRHCLGAATAPHQKHTTLRYQRLDLRFDMD